MAIFFTSDLHFDHANILGFCNRPYSSVTEMNEALIANWNSVVTPDDEIYELGDFTFSRNPKFVDNILSRLNGRKYHIWGNHDQIFHKHPELQKHFIWCKDYFELNYNKIKFILFHYPILLWNGMKRNSIQVQGHEHGNIDTINLDARRIDVGVDAMYSGMKPISIDKILEIMEGRENKKIQHHQKMES